MGASLYSLHMPSGLGRRDGFEVNMNQTFPQGMLAGITLVGGRAGD